MAPLSETLSCENQFQEILSLHGNNLEALAAMDSGSAEPPPPRFRFLDIFKLPVLHPFLVILVLMFVLQVNFHDDTVMVMMLMMAFLVILVLTFVLQFCGQGAITFYTVRIFKVILDVFISITFVCCCLDIQLQC